MASPFFVALVVFVTFFALVSSRCDTDGHMEHLYRKNPGLRESMIEEEQRLQQSPRRQAPGMIYTIPVVVHVLYNTAAQNISDEVIYDQIARLNIDYRKENDQSATVSDFVARQADSGIQFVFADVDPDGQPTTGITRTYTSLSSFPSSSDPSYDNQMHYTSKGGHDIWARSTYMNIWVCNLSGSTLGFAQLPGGPAATDGIVIKTNAFGAGPNAQSPYNLGRTLTHEVGHWFNLRHPWGSQSNECSEDDNVADTPMTSAATYDCTLDKVSCSNKVMVQNFMDYPADACMTAFTAGQVARSRDEFETGGRRATLPIIWNGDVPGLGDYESPYGGTSGVTGASDEESSGLDVDFPSEFPIDLDKFDITEAPYLYVLIGVGACVGVTICAGILMAIVRKARRH